MKGTIDFVKGDLIVSRHNVPFFPRVGESVHVRDEEGEYLSGVVKQVYWGDYVDGEGKPTGELCVSIELEEPHAE